MNDVSVRRLTAAAGLAVVGVTIVAGAFVSITDLPGTQASPQELIAYFTSHRGDGLKSLWLTALGFSLFVPFAVGVRDRLGRAEGGTRLFANLGLASALATVAVLVMSVAPLMAVVYRMPAADPGVVAAVYDTSFVGFALSGILTAISLAAFSASALRSRALPTLVVWFGFAAAAAHVVSAIVFKSKGFLSLEGDAGIYMPFFFYVWVAMVSVALLRGRDTGPGSVD